jgi:hypothetical protein
MGSLLLMYWRDRPTPPLESAAVQPSSSLDDVPYPRDYYTPTGKGASGCVLRALIEEVAAVEVAVKETELKSPKKKTKVIE